MSPEPLITFAIASTLLALVPGPDNIFVLTQSALFGRKSGIFITLGLCTGLLVHTSVVALGIAALFLVSQTAFTVLKLIGASYLLYLAWNAFLAKARNMNGNAMNVPELAALYQQGFILNLSNPKIAIFFLAFLPQFANPEAGNLAGQLFLLGIIFLIISLIVFILIASLAGLISQWLKRSAKAQLLLNRIAGLVFISLALRLATASR
ncbi:MAG: LysE family translocator [Gammaproteobacteria bacterium]|nr:LysE family translocator [Gammaproteobacteria bacterium]